MDALRTPTYSLRRLLSGLLFGLGTVLVLSGLAYAGLWGYLLFRESASPSTQQMLVLAGGTQVPLVQPAPATSERAPALRGSSQHTLAPGPTPTMSPHLPPERISIPRIAVDWPVVLGHNQSLPRFRGVGWLMGSAYPGLPGNMVLFGHRDGPYGTFMRLHELQQNDVFTVTTQADVHRYRVTAVFETTIDDVAQLLPSEDSTATLITCSGPWDALRQTNERRLIVKAALITD